MLKLDQTKTDKTKKEEDEEEDDDEDDDDDDQENFFDDFLDLKFNNRAEIERAKKDVRAQKKQVVEWSGQDVLIDYDPQFANIALA